MYFYLQVSSVTFWRMKRGEVKQKLAAGSEGVVQMSEKLEVEKASLRP